MDKKSHTRSEMNKKVTKCYQKGNYTVAKEIKMEDQVTDKFLVSL